MKINTIITSTARTRKMPKPIPALKISAIAVHELTVNDISDNKNGAISLEYLPNPFRDGSSL
jgi:hypothetical protein